MADSYLCGRCGQREWFRGPARLVDGDICPSCEERERFEARAVPCPGCQKPQEPDDPYMVHDGLCQDCAHERAKSLEAQAKGGGLADRDDDFERMERQAREDEAREERRLLR